MGHIVLANAMHKQQVIETSPILKAYWTKLRKLVDGAERIFLIGYSGGDEHLNAMIKLLEKTTKTFVIGRHDEPRADKTLESAKEEFDQHWRRLLPGCTPIPMANILDFRDWDNYPPKPVAE